jgi:hypothetical protein
VTSISQTCLLQSGDGDNDMVAEYVVDRNLFVTLTNAVVNEILLPIDSAMNEPTAAAKNMRVAIVAKAPSGVLW